MALIVSPAACATYAGLHASDAGALPAIEAMEAAAVRLLERETGRAYALDEGRAELYCAAGGYRVILDNPYRSTPAVSYRTAIGGDWTALAADEFELHGRDLYAVNGWPDEEFPTVLVVGDVGYAPPGDSEEASGDAPADLVEAVKSLVADRYRTRTLVTTDGGEPTGPRLRDVRDSVRLFIVSQRITRRGLHAPDLES